MVKVLVNAPLDYLIGHLRYGHYEGVLEFTDEEFKEFEKDPLNIFINHYLNEDCDLLVDDFEIEDHGNVTEVDYKIIEQTHPITNKVEITI